MEAGKRREVKHSRHLHLRRGGAGWVLGRGPLPSCSSIWGLGFLRNLDFFLLFLSRSPLMCRVTGKQTEQ